MEQELTVESITQMAEAILKGHGFKKTKRFIVSRENEHLRQGFEFQPGRSPREGKFRVNIFWKFKVAPHDECTQDFSDDGDLIANNDKGWWSISKADVEKALQMVVKNGIPFLDNYFDLKKLIVMYESDPEVYPMFMGIEESARYYNLGYSYLALGDVDTARIYLERMIAYLDRWAPDTDRFINLKKKVKAKIKELA